MKLVVVGAGFMASYAHLPSVREELALHPGRFELTAVVDPDEGRRERVMTDFGFGTGFASVAEMLKTIRPDVALTLTPYWLNAQVSAELLAAGVSVLMEKPPGMNRAETLRLIELTQQSKCVAQVGFNRRHWPPLRLALEWLREDAQPLQFMRGTKHRTGRIREDYAFFTSSHVIDTLLSVGGEPVECTTARTPVPGVTEAWNFISTIRFANGCVAHATGMPHVSFNQEIYEFHTLASTIVVDPHWGKSEDAEVFQYRGDKLDRRVVFPKGDDQQRVNGFLGQLQTFLDAVEGRDPAYPTVEQCLRTIELSEAIRAGQTWRASDNLRNP